METYHDLTVVQAEELIRYSKSNYSIDLVPKSLVFPCKIKAKAIVTLVDAVRGIYYRKGYKDEWVQYEGHAGR